MGDRPSSDGHPTPDDSLPSDPPGRQTTPNDSPIGGNPSPSRLVDQEADEDALLTEASVSHRGGGRGRRGRYAFQDLTSGSIPKHLARLSWPQVTERVLNITDQMVDLIWAGRLPGGFRAIAGLGVAQSFTQFSMTARMGLDQALRAMISRAVGAGNIPFANHLALQGFTLSAAYSLVMVFVGLFLTDIFLRVIGASTEVQAETAMYMRVQFVGMAAQGFRMSSASALQASGDVMTPLKSTTVTRVIHITLTPFLMFGWWGFPAFGLAGAALANVLSQAVGFGINGYALFHGSSRLHLTFRGYRVDYRVLLRIIKIGLPASVAATERTTAQLILLRLVSPFGDVTLAAYALTRRFEMFANFGSMGVGQSAGILAGQNLGAGRPDRARQAVGWGLVYVTVIMSGLMAILLIFPAAITAFFTSNPEVVALTATWLRILALGFIFMSLGMVFQQSFNTAGDTLAPMIFTLIALWGMELPLAWLMAYGLHIGPLGFAYARIIAMASRLALYVPYFFWGRWLRVKVL